MPVTVAHIQAARKRIAERVYLSPCPRSVSLSDVTGCSVYCKLDLLQRTGSFKERGACNALSQLDAERRRRGVIAASAGNHALGLAYHGKLLDIPVTVVMPEFAPLIKRTTCRQLGAEVILCGETFADAKTRADQLVAERGLTYVHGYDDEAVIAGQGTMGLEILEQVPKVDAVIVPVGGGGLLAGVAIAIKTLQPEVTLIGVEPERAASLTAAMEAGHPVDAPMEPTLADGLAVPRMGDHTFEIVRKLVDQVITVQEDEIALAILRIIELEKAVVEGAGAAPLAALLSGKLPELRGKSVVLPFCGGNIDPTILDRVIETGLVADGRLCRFTAVISDRPGGLAKFAGLIASTGASIKQVEHDRAFAGADVSATRVICTVETSDREHIHRIQTLLESSGINYSAG